MLRLLSIALALATVGCATAPLRELHPLAGDTFTLFPPDRREPEEITCRGAPDERFRCFADEVEDRVGGSGASGALVLLHPEQSHALTIAPVGQRPAVDNETRFPVGSVTKMFIGATVVSLSEDAVVDLNEPIAKYLTELKEDHGPGRATLHQLLTHTAGMPIGEQCSNGDDDIDDVVRSLKDQKLWSPPGAVFNYSNIGYTYVAAVIERVTGKRFEQVAHERVLAPTGLRNATFDPAAASVPSISVDGPAVRSCRAMWPSGGLVLNLVELSHWLAAVSRPERSALGPRIVGLIGAPHVNTGGRPGETYGYGVMQFSVGGERILSHGGLLPGYSAFVAWVPRYQVGAGAFANVHASAPAAAVARGISTFLSLPADWNAPARPARPLSSYAGTYKDGAGGLGRVRVAVEGDHLAMDYLDGTPPLLAANFSFFFDEGSDKARYVATEVGVGERETEAARAAGRRSASSP